MVVAARSLPSSLGWADEGVCPYVFGGRFYSYPLRVCFETRKNRVVRYADAAELVEELGINRFNSNSSHRIHSRVV